MKFLHYVRVADLLYIIDRLHHVYLTHELFGLPVYTSDVASPSTEQQLTKGKKTHNA